MSNNNLTTKNSQNIISEYSSESVANLLKLIFGLLGLIPPFGSAVSIAGTALVDLCHSSLNEKRRQLADTFNTDWFEENIDKIKSDPKFLSEVIVFWNFLLREANKKKIKIAQEIFRSGVKALEEGDVEELDLAKVYNVLGMLSCEDIEAFKKFAQENAITENVGYLASLSLLKNNPKIKTGDSKDNFIMNGSHNDTTRIQDNYSLTNFGEKFHNLLKQNLLKNEEI